MIVVDANVLAVSLVDDGEDGMRARERLRGERLAARELIDLEIVSVLRGLQRSGQLGLRRAELAVVDLGRLPIERASHRSLVTRCWQLQDNNLTAYDVAYVALAEALAATLVTGDAHLARSNGPRCAIELMT